MAKKRPRKYEFMGRWEDGDNDGGPPWERFRVELYGHEAGDFVSDAREINRILKASGYELILRKKEKNHD